jgi:putative transposase
VDTQGLLLGVVVHAADIQDADGLGGLLKRVKPLYSWLRTVFADSIYNRLAALLACFLAGLVLIIVRRVAGTIGFVMQPRRWVVERSLGWLGRWRRLAKDYEALPEVSEAMVTLAMIRLHAPPPRPPKPQASTRALTSQTGSQARRRPNWSAGWRTGRTWRATGWCAGAAATCGSGSRAYSGSASTSARSASC